MIGRVELHSANNQGFRSGPSDSKSGSDATGPVPATMQKPT